MSWRERGEELAESVWLTETPAVVGSREGDGGGCGSMEKGGSFISGGAYT